MPTPSERAEQAQRRHKRPAPVVTNEKRSKAADWTISRAIEHAAKNGGSSEKAHQDAAKAIREADRKQGK